MTDVRTATSRSRPRSPLILTMAFLPVRASGLLRWAAVALNLMSAEVNGLSRLTAAAHPGAQDSLRVSTGERAATGHVTLRRVAVSASLRPVSADAVIGKAMTDTSPAATRAT